MSEEPDVLGRYLELIEVTDYRKLAQWEKTNIVRAMRLLAAALRAERRRVAKLEPDAKLGRMVREMPVEQRLIHTVYGDWWYGRNVRGEFGATGASPEAVLEAARKEIP